MDSGVAPSTLEEKITKIMEAEARVYTAGRENRARKQMWAMEFPPLKVEPRLLGKRKNGTNGYAWDVKLEDVNPHSSPSVGMHKHQPTHEHMHAHAFTHTHACESWMCIPAWACGARAEAWTDACDARAEPRPKPHKHRSKPRKP